MRRAARIDANQRQVVQALRAMGCSVQSLAELGAGVPDLLVGYRNLNLLIECKDGAKPPSARRLTADQKAWHDAWRGQKAVVEGWKEAVDYVAQWALGQRA